MIYRGCRGARSGVYKDLFVVRSLVVVFNMHQALVTLVELSDLTDILNFSTASLPSWVIGRVRGEHHFVVETLDCCPQLETSPPRVYVRDLPHKRMNSWLRHDLQVPLRLLSSTKQIQSSTGPDQSWLLRKKLAANFL